MKTFFTSIISLLFLVKMQAQDIHFARVQDMSTWYNQSLQTSRDIMGYVNYRNVKYQGIIAFRSGAFLANIPLVTKQEKAAANKGYITLSAGAAIDKSNSRVLSNTMGLLGISYSLPVDAKGKTYISAGFQGSLLQSRISMANATLPDQFDKFGMIPNRPSNDPMVFSSISYFSLNTGVSIFNIEDKRSWYIGASARHVNRPVTNKGEAERYHLPVTIGMQFGYGTSVSEEGKLNMYGVLNWKARAYEHLIGLQYIHNFKEYNKGLGIGIAYRYKDAIIPNVELRWANTSLAFHYDYNISSIRSNGFSRECYELGIRHKF